MGINKKVIFFCVEILYNNLGQIFFRRRFLISSSTSYFRYILEGS